MIKCTHPECEESATGFYSLDGIVDSITGEPTYGYGVYRCDEHMQEFVKKMNGGVMPDSYSYYRVNYDH